MKRYLLNNKSLVLSKDFILNNLKAGILLLKTQTSNNSMINNNQSYYRFGFQNKLFNTNKHEKLPNVLLKIPFNNFCKKLPRHKKLTLPNLSPSMEKVLNTKLFIIITIKMYILGRNCWVEKERRWKISSWRKYCWDWNW